MADTLKLVIVTPEGVALSEEVDMVTLPAVEGEMGIYPQHVPLMTQLAPGVVTANRKGQVFSLTVSEGFVEITGSHVSVLTDLAVNAKADEAEARAARERAEARIRERRGTEEVAAAEAAFTRSLTRPGLQLKGKRHPPHN
jgi:F-type H+-transporting ATPase subunit epsilon